MLDGTVYSPCLSECGYLTINRTVTIKELHASLKTTITKLVGDHTSWAHRPDTSRGGMVPINGLKCLLDELDGRTADKKYYHAWLSLLHKRGHENPIFLKFDFNDETG